MNIGIPKESRPFEYRVGLSPAGVEILVQNGHQVILSMMRGYRLDSVTKIMRRSALVLFFLLKNLLDARIWC